MILLYINVTITNTKKTERKEKDRMETEKGESWARLPFQRLVTLRLLALMGIYLCYLPARMLRTCIVFKLCPTGAQTCVRLVI